MIIIKLIGSTFGDYDENEMNHNQPPSRVQQINCCLLFFRLQKPVRLVISFVWTIHSSKWKRTGESNWEFLIFYEISSFFQFFIFQSSNVCFRLTDGGLLVSVDGSSYTSYMKEEASNYRITIANKTCVFEKENDPTILRWEFCDKLYYKSLPLLQIVLVTID